MLISSAWLTRSSPELLVTVGSRLVRELHARGEPVGCVVRDPSRVSFDPTVAVHRADMLDPSSLSAIGDGYTTAYYLGPLDGPRGATRL